MDVSSSVAHVRVTNNTAIVSHSHSVVGSNSNSMGAIVAPVGISLRLSFSLTLAIVTPHSGRVTIANMVSESAVGSNSKSMGAIVAPLGISLRLSFSLTLAIVTPHSGRVAIANMVSKSTVGS